MDLADLWRVVREGNADICKRGSAAFCPEEPFAWLTLQPPPPPRPSCRGRCGALLAAAQWVLGCAGACPREGMQRRSSQHPRPTSLVDPTPRHTFPSQVSLGFSLAPQLPGADVELPLQAAPSVCTLRSPEESILRSCYSVQWELSNRFENLLTGARNLLGHQIAALRLRLRLSCGTYSAGFVGPAQQKASLTQKERVKTTTQCPGCPGNTVPMGASLPPGQRSGHPQPVPLFQVPQGRGEGVGSLGFSGALAVSAPRLAQELS
ncbi:PREDICTED: uncharacterized protein LOC102017325 [Chinchilla lanigera]|uniref:uncharacterized protein LOC102017325 n=1 Tax=Chinchilla lanigera TaxID=34839 RepID=UPI00038EA5D9|nr:PREDICTED: uncharacterized protein LOC102017325 [Chinchilla lanigera]